jgi:hypothetical protein
MVVSVAVPTARRTQWICGVPGMRPPPGAVEAKRSCRGMQWGVIPTAGAERLKAAGAIAGVWG